MAADPEWVEIIEPRTQEHMFANLTTGECVWDPPEGVPVKKTNSNQWWELFDQNTSRFYYYNAVSQKTVWHRPSNCDIIPLAKLQTLKQNTEVKQQKQKQRSLEKAREDVSESTQTAEVLLDRMPSRRSTSLRTKITASTSMQTSPMASPRPLRRSKHQRHQHRRAGSEISGLNAHSPSSDESKLYYQSSAKMTKQHAGSQDVLYSTPHKETPFSQRYLFNEKPLSPEDRRRTSIGPSQAKYYSIPHNHSSQQPPPQSQMGYAMPFGKTKGHSYEENGHKNDSPRSFASSISRSVSFMSRQPTRGSDEQQQYGNGQKHGYDQGSGRSMESTPQSHRRTKGSPESNHSGSLYANSPKNSDIGSPIDGYCTPMINRRQMTPSDQSGRSGSGSKKFAGESQTSPQKQEPSISELVDSGLSALKDGQPQFKQPQIRNPNQISKEKYSQLKHHYKLRRNKDGTLERGSSKMSPLQQYILEQAKLSGYRFGDPLDADRDSYIESEDDWMDKHDDSDDFADDEDGGASDSISKASSVDGEDGGRFLSEPTYNNLDVTWLQSVNNYQSHHMVPMNKGGTNQGETDAFSEEFDLRMRISHRNNHQGSTSSSTIPRPSSHQPTSSTSMPQQPKIQAQNSQYQNPSYPVPYDVLHPSLQRNTFSMIDTKSSSSNIRGSNTLSSNNNNNNHHSTSRSQSRAASEMTDRGSMLSASTSIHSTISCESDIEKYAQDNLNIPKKGLFRKKMTVKDVLTHTKEPIRKPLTCITDKSAKKEAIEVFRLLQIYMGDRRAKQNMTINSVALDITTKGFSRVELRDEIYVQLCKQTTENNSRESLRRGWELMAICLAFFPPSSLFTVAMYSYIQKHRDPGLDYPDVGKWPIHVQISHYAGICAKRLDKIGESGRLAPRKPTVEDIDQSRLQIFRPSMFGNTLQEVMEMQRDRFPQRRLPWLLTTLADQILQLNGNKTEGIFRVPADLDEVNSMKSRFDQWEVPVCVDCHTAASLLKLWLRELYEPVIPDKLYDLCVKIGDDESANLPEVIHQLPTCNKDVLFFLVRYLQNFSRPEIANVTKMDSSNLGTVFAPNFLRCPSSDPLVMMENTRKEMAFVKNLIVNLDTSPINGVM